MRLIFKQRIWGLRRIQQKSWRRLRKQRIRGLNHKKAKHWWTDDVHAPVVFSLLHKRARTDVIAFLGKLEKLAKRPNVFIRLNFRDTSKMFAEATLLFKATLHQLCELHPNVRIKCSSAKNQRINEVLTQTGVLALLGQTFHVQPRDESVIHWRVTEGHGADGEKYEPVLGDYDEKLGDNLSYGLYLGITEAMTNTRHHAYPNHSPATEWWIFSQKKDGWLTVAICDLGVGIPATIPCKMPWAWRIITRAYGSKVKDSKIMDATIRLKKTRTRRGHRGKGLTQLASIVERAQPGSLFYIFSGKGCYSKNGKTVKLDDYDTPIGGTVITWRLPLNTEAVCNR